MRRLFTFLLASGLFWSGCAGNATLGTSATAQRNVENLARISVGMTDTQVFRIMRQPYKNQKIQIEGDQYEVWFYITKPTLMEQTKMVHMNFTPLTFKNGILRGTGYEYYNSVVKKEAIAVKLEKGTPETEDIKLEKALETPQSQTQPPAQQAPSKKKTTPSQPPPQQTPQTPPPSGPGQTKPKQQNQPAGQKKGGTSTKGQVSMSKKITPADKPPEKPLEGGPVQPHAEQPPAPVQPPPPINPLAPPPPPSEKDGKKPATPKKETPATKSSLSMTKKPPPAAEAPPEKPPEDDKKKVPLTEKDQQMIDQEEEENFDFW